MSDVEVSTRTDGRPVLLSASAPHFPSTSSPSRGGRLPEAGEDLIEAGAVGPGSAGAQVGRRVQRAHFLRDRGSDELIEATPSSRAGPLGRTPDQFGQPQGERPADRSLRRDQPKNVLMRSASTPPIVMPCIHFMRLSSALITATS